MLKPENACVFAFHTRCIIWFCADTCIFVSHNAKCTILKMHWNATQCVIFKFATASKCITKCIACSYNALQCLQSRKTGDKHVQWEEVAQQECELFPASFFRIRGLVGRPKVFVNIVTQQEFRFFSNAKLSKLQVNATLECIGVAQTLNAVFVLHAKCIILSIALQCIQTRKMADKQVH